MTKRSFVASFRTRPSNLAKSSIQVHQTPKSAAGKSLRAGHASPDLCCLPWRIPSRRRCYRKVPPRIRRSVCRQSARPNLHFGSLERAEMLLRPSALWTGGRYRAAAEMATNEISQVLALQKIAGEPWKSCIEGEQAILLVVLFTVSLQSLKMASLSC